MVGEGPDEICSSYLFNYYAPSDEALHLCSQEYVKNIMYDGRRRCCVSRWGLEARVPFLDPEFIREYLYSCNMRHPKHKDFEKYWLRAAFDGLNLADEVL